MKKLLFTLPLLFLVFAGVTVSAQLLPTNLKITVIDDLGNSVKGATVVIYENEKDYLNEKNEVATLKTDKKGKVKFKKLKPKKYFLMARKGDQNNQGGGEVTGKLVAGRTNKLNVVIQ